MKKFLIVLAAVLLAASCNEDDPAAPETNKQVSPYSGTFNVDFQLEQTTCNFPPPLDQLNNITVDEEDFKWGGATGTWDEDEKTGYGTTAQTCVPIHPVTGCMGCFEIQYDVTFANPDSFYGDVTVPYDYSDECQTDDCSSTYDVTGVRVK